jgi:threonine dehydratase
MSQAEQMAADWEPDRSELEAIHAGSAETVRETPAMTLGALSRICGGEVVLKAESMQRTGSFKLRGTVAKMRGRSVADCRGVVTGSAGNHGQALAFAARERAIPCTVFMPGDATVSKVDAVRAFGAEVQAHSGSVDDCVAAAADLAAEEGLLFVHPFDDPEIIKGQAGVGIEIARQVPDLARVIVPVGGGGLIAGIAAALRVRPEVEVVGVQAAGCPSFGASREAGEPRAVARSQTIADGIAVKKPGALNFGLVQRWVEELVTVDDDAIAAAMVLLLERGKLVAEGAGAVGVAALMTGAVTPAASGATVVVISGGNVDASMLASVINRHQTGIGRRVRLFSRISDRPGGLVAFLRNVADSGGNVLDVTHVRDGVPLHVKETGVEVIVESRGEDHREELLAHLRESGYEVVELT